MPAAVVLVRRSFGGYQPRFSASASSAAFSRGLSCSQRSRIWVAILNFFNEQKSTRGSVTSRLKPHTPLINRKLRALSRTRAAQWANARGAVG